MNLRIFRIAPIVPAFILLIVLAGCGSSASVSGILKQKGIPAKDASGLKIELRFLKESKGSNYKFVDISGNADLTGELFAGLSESKAADKPQDKHFSPELRSDCEILLANKNGETVSFFYIIQGNLLVYPVRSKDKDGETLEYRYFTPGEKLASLVQGQEQYASLMQENAAKPFMNMEELKSSIDPGELAEEGTEIDFEFFADKTPDNAGTACRIYTNAEFGAVPPGSYLITAYGKTNTGGQEKLSIQGMEANSNYTKILVAEPDEALDSVDTGNALPDSYAITVKEDAIDPAKWIVFVDAGNNVIDVILPEDIASISSAPAQPGAGATTAGQASSSHGAEASASAGSPADGEGPADAGAD
jgi:hypothetical protein